LVKGERSEWTDKATWLRIKLSGIVGSLLTIIPWLRRELSGKVYGLITSKLTVIVAWLMISRLTAVVFQWGSKTIVVILWEGSKLKVVVSQR
jgi:hypothetical protein